MLVLALPRVNEPLPAITPVYSPLTVWFTVNAWLPARLIVAEFVPLDGVAIVPLKEPVVVAAVADRLRTVAVPATVLGLLTASGPVVAPKPDAPRAVNVPALTVVPPE